MQTGIVVGRSKTLTISSTCNAAILLMFFEITVRVCETNNLSAKYLFAMYTDGDFEKELNQAICINRRVCLGGFGN